jgi:curli biogenesis system outer membrane secretion channel CsgG
LRGYGCATGLCDGKKVERQISQLPQIEMRSETSMTRKIHLLILLIGLATVAGQGAPQAKPAASKGNPQVDAVIEMVKSGLSEAFIVKKLVKDNKPVNLTTADMVKLKQAGVSENIMNVMMDPSSPASAAAPAPAPPAPAAPDTAPAPATEPPPAPAPAAVVTAAAPVAAKNGDKKRVAVEAFDYSAVMTSVQAVFGSQQNIGKGIQAMLINRMTQSGKLIVVDREKLEKVKNEQQMGLGSSTQQGKGARVGRIRGADAILAGDITIFGRDDKKIGGGGGGCKAWDIRCGGGHFGLKKDKAVVAMTYRLIDAETTEVIATGEARGESKRTGVMGNGGGGDFWKGHGGGGFDMTSSNFAETIIGEATQACVNKLADILDDQAATMKRTVREVETSVVDVTGNTLMIGAGDNDGVSVGEVFEIHHILKEVKDPNTQEVLDRKTEVIGQLTITSVRPKVATGTYSGAPPLATKDFVAIKKLPPQ